MIGPFEVSNRCGKHLMHIMIFDQFVISIFAGLCEHACTEID